MLIRRAEIEGRGVTDLRLSSTRIVEIGRNLSGRAIEPVVDAGGGALLPGLHDHHLHLFAMAAALRSVRCGPPDVHDAGELQRVLATARPHKGWIRGTAYHDSVAGPLTRAELDAWQSRIPVRIQHRSGVAWSLNSAALAQLGLGRARLSEAIERGVERDRQGRPTGRLFRLDSWLRQCLGESDFPRLARVGRRLSRFGVTGVTDATATNGEAEMAALARAVERGELPQRLLVMGKDSLPASECRGVARGAVKVMLSEHDLPDLEALEAAIRAGHSSGRPVAMHCVTRSELVFAAVALAAAGARPGDRIEHASVAPPELVRLLAPLRVTVVTQPGFLLDRGDAYAREVEPSDLAWLYRGSGLLSAGVPLGAGTDAPFGPADPWLAIRAAAERRTRGGLILGAGEELTPERALALFTTSLDAPGGAPRRVEVGAPADLCLLDRPWAQARERLRSEDVALTWCRGEVVWDRDERVAADPCPSFTGATGEGSEVEFASAREI